MLGRKTRSRLICDYLVSLRPLSCLIFCCSEHRARSTPMACASLALAQVPALTTHAQALIPVIGSASKVPHSEKKPTFPGGRLWKVRFEICRLAHDESYISYPNSFTLLQMRTLFQISSWATRPAPSLECNAALNRRHQFHSLICCESGTMVMVARRWLFL
jgi:hypothetical protein